MESVMLHSFGVLAYKDSPFLVDCLESLKKQTVKSEIFISTSTPSPYIEKLAETYGVKLFVGESGKGMANDWNFCLRKARTKYITLAHQDDVYLPEYAEKCIDRSEMFSDSLICFTDYAEIYNENIRKSTLLLIVKKFIISTFFLFRPTLSAKLLKKGFLSFGNPIAAPSVMFNLEILRSFNFSSDYKINLDWDAWYRLSIMNGKFVFVNEILMLHRIHEESETTIGINSNQRKNEDMAMFKRLWPRPIANALAFFYKKSYRQF